MRQRITRIPRRDEIAATSIEYRTLNGERCELKYKGEWVPAFDVPTGKFYPTFFEFCVKHKWYRGLALARGLGGKLKNRCLGFLPTLVVEADWFELENRNDAAIWCLADLGLVKEVKALFYMTRVVKKDDQLRMLDHAKKRRVGIDALRAERKVFGKVPSHMEKPKQRLEVLTEPKESLREHVAVEMPRRSLLNFLYPTAQQILFDNRPVSRIGRLWYKLTKRLSLPLVLGCMAIVAGVYLTFLLGWG